ncbi:MULTISPECIES: efflux RND transporter periplasmic adaptor subunit [Pseudoalteromonas]|uniref:Efflux RND transporter periplasmic adaptor subunit n=1 Tax=Pseudoalteromonas undina TaxID=43660 RepID=A0ACC6R373_9GAMM|nr:efflux RND transporter periplasmic adaptor subunit [Pseudoalteromonas sp. P1-25]
MALGLSALIGGLSYFKFKQVSSAIEMAESFPEHYEVVEVAYVKDAEHMPTISVLGSAQSPLHLELFTELPGKVAFIGAPIGKKVEQGELLVQLDITAEKAGLKAATAREKLAQSILHRSKKLLDKSAISQELYDQAYADLIVIQSEIELLESTISKKTVIAPFKGIMGLHSIKLGDYVAANKMLASYVGITDKVWAEFDIPQFYPPLPIGSDVRVRNIDAFGSSLFQTATVIAKDTQIASNTRSLKYRAVIDRKHEQYSPNTPLEVLVPISDKERVFQVPVTSVNHDMHGTYVMKLVANGTEPETYRAKRLPVKVVSQFDGYKLITLNEIKEGDKIAAAGAFKLYEGILVMPMKRSSTAKSPLAMSTGEL